MITSTINEILLKNEIKETQSKTNSKDFLNSLISTSENTDNKAGNIKRNDSLVYDNIKGISLEEIDANFKDEESNQMAKNLRIATLFTEDKILGQALFDTVLGKPFSLGYSYLYDRYEDKNSFLNSSNSNSLSDLLHSSISNKIDNLNNTDNKVTDVISQDRLDEILTTVNSFSFVEALSKTTKDQYGRYKDEDENDYSFLYNDYALQYEQLMFKYEELDNINKNLIRQF